jgi:hypothetical protein
MLVDGCQVVPFIDVARLLLVYHMDQGLVQKADQWVNGSEDVPEIAVTRPLTGQDLGFSAQFPPAGGWLPGCSRHRRCLAPAARTE